MTDLGGCLQRPGHTYHPSVTRTPSAVSHHSHAPSNFTGYYGHVTGHGVDYWPTSPTGVASYATGMNMASATSHMTAHMGHAVGGSYHAGLGAAPSLVGSGAGECNIDYKDSTNAWSKFQVL